MIPPLIINNRVITNLRKNQVFSIIFFALQCTPIINYSKLKSAVQYRRENRLTRATFEEEDILKISRSLDVYKAHGHDDISVRLHI